MLEWIEGHRTLMWGTAAASVVVFLGTLIVVPFIVVRIPADYFAHEHREHVHWADRHPVIRLSLLVLQNVVGVVFIVVGLAMLLLPGQGLLTMLIGFMLVTGPGKYQLERWLVNRRPIKRTIDWLRRRGGRPPLEVWTGEET